MNIFYILHEHFLTKPIFLTTRQYRYVNSHQGAPGWLGDISVLVNYKPPTGGFLMAVGDKVFGHTRKRKPEGFK